MCGRLAFEGLPLKVYEIVTTGGILEPNQGTGCHCQLISDGPPSLPLSLAEPLQVVYTQLNDLSLRDSGYATYTSR